MLDTDKTLTPVLDTDSQSKLYLLDLAAGKQRLGGSILAQVYEQMGNEVADLDDPHLFKNGFLAMQVCLKSGLLNAYHDRSDGGIVSALVEMAFASRCGLKVSLPGDDALAAMFNEELGMVVQVSDENLAAVETILAGYNMSAHWHVLGAVTADQIVSVAVNGNEVLSESRVALHRIWSETTYQMQSHRDNPECAQQEYDRLLDTSDRGLFSDLSFDPSDDIAAAFIGQTKPKIAVLREQGVNGQLEMGAAFTQAGFDAIDVTMTDLIEGRQQLTDFNGLVACGGFSYGDVLGAGEGWAKSILFNTRMHDQFAEYFARQDAFALGICNGCQMMSNLKSIVPGANAWPHFVRNASEQFEARVVQTQIPISTKSVLLEGMKGSLLPVVVAHGEGRAEYSGHPDLENLALRYVDSKGQESEAYPANPNGSPFGVAGLSNDDGRITIMMPHPERIFRSVTNSWRDDKWGEYSPWMRMFRNARVWLS